MALELKQQHCSENKKDGRNGLYSPFQVGMVQQLGAPARRGAQVFADAHRQGFDVGAGWMSWASGARGLDGWLQGCPVEEGEERQVLKSLLSLI